MWTIPFNETTILTWGASAITLCLQILMNLGMINKIQV